MKARIKSFEDMPSEFKCCPQTIEAMKPYHGKEIELSTRTVNMNDTCPWCKYNIKGLGLVYENGFGAIFPQCVDIDEGHNN